jgi:hypothetical protein
VRLGDFRGKWLLIVPWNTYSREYLPPREVQEVFDAHRDGRLAILGVTNSTPSAARMYVDARHIPWPTATAKPGGTVPRSADFSNNMNPILIGPDGKVIAILKQIELKAVVEKALQR